MATRVDITRRGGQVVFAPSPVQIPAGESVFWRNLDPQEEHWIVHTADRLPAFVSGQTAATSSEVVFSQSQAYSCSLHPGETGQVDV